MMLEKFDFKTGDIIKWCDQTYEVLENLSGYSGTVAEWNNGVRGNEAISRFHWDAFGEKSVLVSRAN